MPDHAALTAAIFAYVANPFDQPLDAEYLLITGNDLAGLFIEQREVASYLQQSGRGKQTDKQLILAS
ncbi:hypothetical protein D3C77_575590 [compost metagenome]